MVFGLAENIDWWWLEMIIYCPKIGIESIMTELIVKLIKEKLIEVKPEIIRNWYANEEKFEKWTLLILFIFMSFISVSDKYNLSLLLYQLGHS